MAGERQRSKRWSHWNPGLQPCHTYVKIEAKLNASIQNLLLQTKGKHAALLVGEGTRYVRDFHTERHVRAVDSSAFMRSDSQKFIICAVDAMKEPHLHHSSRDGAGGGVQLGQQI